MAGLVVAAAGCGSEPGEGATVQSEDAASSGGPGCELAPLGDATLPIEMKVVACGPDLVSREVDDGDEVPLVLPTQGGRVTLIGASATNIDACNVQLSAALRDVATGQVTIDSRTIALESTGDGWGGSVDGNSSSFANIGSCPNQWASTDVFDHEFELTVHLTEASGRSSSRTLRVVPYCAEPENVAACKCLCKAGYTDQDGCGY